MPSTGTIRRIAIAAAETAIPTLPAVGADIDWSALSAWETLGKTEDGDLGNLDEDSIDMTPVEETLVLKPPLAQAPESEIMFSNYIEEFSFVTYSMSGEILALSSTATQASGVVEEGVDITYKAVIVEIAGVGIDYYPKCRVKVSGRPAGIKAWAKIEVTVKTFGTSSVPGGHQFKAFGT